MEIGLLAAASVCLRSLIIVVTVSAIAGANANLVILLLLNKRECDLSQSKVNFFVERVSKKNS